MPGISQTLRDWLIEDLLVGQLQIQSDLAVIKSALTSLQTGVKKMAATIDDVTAKVAAETTVEQGAITLLGELSAMIKAAATDPVKIQAIADQLDANQTALAAAVAANTPAA